MSMTPFAAIVRKDLMLFLSDRAAVTMAFIVPIAIGSFFGAVFSGPRTEGETAKVGIAIVDEDGSAISRGIIASARTDKNLAVSTGIADAVREDVRRGRTTVGVIIPKGFGDAAGKAFFSGGEKPQLDLLYDPSHGAELAMVRGVLTQHVMQAVSKEMFSGPGGQRMVDETLARIDELKLAPAQRELLRDMLSSVRRFYQQEGTGSAAQAPGMTLPYAVREEAVTARANVAYNAYAHSFAGMGVQFLLFAAANLGVEILLERQRGQWKRLRSAPLSKLTLLGAKTASMTIVALMSLLVSFGFAIAVWGVRIHGSMLGFLSVAVACALMASAFGLLIAALGRTPAATRGVTTLAVLLMVMLGGAWVPTFIFPAWLQRITVVVPARWAVDGLDAMTWRGIGLGGAIAPTLAMLGFAVLFWAIAVARFRWEEA
jgi:ABC-type multidrug transport system permease subunit